jgi:hypothetical protein
MKKLKLYRFDTTDIPEKFHDLYHLTKDEVVVMLGEIKGMDGHCVVASKKTGLVHIGYHTDNFTKIKEEDL